MLADYLLFFELYYLTEMMTLLLINKVIYISFISNMLKKRYVKQISKILGVYLFFGGIIFYYVNIAAEGFHTILSLFFVATIFFGALSYVFLINNSHKKAKWFFIAILLIDISETIVAVSFFIERSMIYM